MSRVGVRAPVCLIAAHSSNLVIGHLGTIPWDIPIDFRRFVRIVRQQPSNRFLMGRTVFNELQALKLFPLTPAEHCVVSSDPSVADGVVGSVRVASLDEFQRKLAAESAAGSCDPGLVYVLGGARLYAETISHASFLRVTQIHTSFHGDRMFPEYRSDRQWVETSRRDVTALDRRSGRRVPLSFVDYRRVDVAQRAP
jgi:dihydrofolate reductase